MRLHEQPVRVQVEPTGATVTLVLGFDGETNAHWRNLFAEALEKRLGADHPERPSRAKVTEEGIVASGVPRGRRDEAWKVIAAAVHEANTLIAGE